MNPYEEISDILKTKLKVELITHKDEDYVTALRDVIMYSNWKAFNRKAREEFMEQEKANG